MKTAKAESLFGEPIEGKIDLPEKVEVDDEAISKEVQDFLEYRRAGVVIHTPPMMSPMSMTIVMEEEEEKKEPERPKKRTPKDYRTLEIKTGKGLFRFLKDTHCERIPIDHYEK